MGDRDDFPEEVIRLTKMRAAYICSNPDCRVLTIAPSEINEMAVQYCGKVAHITAAASNGPRYDKNISSAERKNVSNAIFLCSNCADLIDKNNGIDYPPEMLFQWKAVHNDWVLKNLNRTNINNDITGTIASATTQIGRMSANSITIVNSPVPVIDKSLEIDKDTFLRAEEVLSEETLHRLYKELMDKAECSIFDSNCLEAIYRFYEKGSNSYINPDIDKLRIELSTSAKSLADFIYSNFDMWPYNQRKENFNIQLRPEYIRFNGYMNPTPEQREIWPRLLKDLTELVNATLQAYIKFRKMVKGCLHI